MYIIIAAVTSSNKTKNSWKLEQVLVQGTIVSAFGSFYCLANMYFLCVTVIRISECGRPTCWVYIYNIGNIKRKRGEFGKVYLSRNQCSDTIIYKIFTFTFGRNIVSDIKTLFLFICVLHTNTYINLNQVKLRIFSMSWNI